MNFLVCEGARLCVALSVTLGVADCVRVRVGVTLDVDDLLGGSEADADLDLLCDGVLVRVWVGVCDVLIVRVGVCVGLDVLVGVWLAVRVLVFVGVFVGVAVTDDVVDRVPVLDCVLVDVGVEVWVFDLVAD